MDKVGFLLSPTPNFLALFHLWIIMSTYMSFCTHVTYNYYVFQQHQRINTWSRLITTFLIFITTQVTLELEKNLCSCISNTVQWDIDISTTLYVDLQIWWIHIAWKWVFTCTSFWWLLLFRMFLIISCSRPCCHVQGGSLHEGSYTMLSEDAYLKVYFSACLSFLIKWKRRQLQMVSLNIKLG